MRLIATIFLLCAWSAGATTWYCSQNGTGNGLSIGAPTNLVWPTISGAIQPGDNVYFEGLITSPVSITVNSGTTANPVRYFVDNNCQSVVQANSTPNDVFNFYFGIDHFSLTGMPNSFLRITNNGTGLGFQVYA